MIETRTMVPQVAPASRPFWKRQLSIPRPHPRDVLAAIGLFALTLALFHAIVFEGRVLYERDICLVWYPQVAAIERALSSGSWPVWDNSIAFGQPLWADPSAQLLYPFTWLHVVLPPWTYYTLFVVTHVAFSALGTFVLARRFDVSRAGAFVAAILWMMSGPFLSLVCLWHHFAGACWIPWVLFTADTALRSPRILNTLAWGGTFAGQILGGSADMCAMTGILVVAHGLRYVEWRNLGGPVNRRLVLSAAGAFGLAIALTAAMWLPALDMVTRSARSDLPAGTRLYWSVHPLAFVQAILPIVWQEIPLRADYAQALFEGREPFLRSLYLGMPALALVAAAFAVPRRPHRRLLALVLLVAALVALGRHFFAFGLAVQLLPPLKILRYPMKVTVPLAFAFAVLGGMGFDVWRSGTGDAARRRFRLLVIGTLLLAAGLGAMAVYVGRFRTLDWGPRFLAPPADAGGALATILAPSVLRVLLSTLLAGAVLVLAMVRGRPGDRHTALAVAILSGLDLLWLHTRLNPTAPVEFIRFRPPLLDAVRQDDHSRLYVREYVLFKAGGEGERDFRLRHPLRLRKDVVSGDISTLAMAKALAHITSLYPPQAGRWGLEGSYDLDLRELYPRPLAEITMLARQTEWTPAYLRLMQMGAVSHVVALQREGFESFIPAATVPSLYEDPVRVFRVPDPLPRTYAVSGVRVADGEPALQVLMDPSFDARSEVILPAGLAVRSTGFSGTSRVVHLQPDRVRIEAELVRPGYLVLVDTYDPGWQARLDGQRVPVLRANVTFRAVQVPAGHHVLEYVCRPRAVLLGLAFSGTALLVAAAVAMICLGRGQGP